VDGSYAEDPEDEDTAATEPRLRDTVASLADTVGALVAAQKKKGQAKAKDADSKKKADLRKCFNCNKVGHIAKDCRLPKKKKEQSGN
jgi:hypothetical protein